MLDKPKILYIEDTADARMLVQRLLSDEYLVLEASNPLDGIELAQDTQPDLLLPRTHNWSCWTSTCRI